DQTLLLWNGIPLNDPYFGGANWQFVPVDGVERIEVLRGPFSALYGSTALGGVVQVFTGSRDGGAPHPEGGENGYRPPRGGAGTGGERYRLDFAGHWRRGDGELANDSFDSEDGVAHATWKIRPGTTLGLLVRADDSDTGIPLSGGLPSPEKRI